MEHSDIQDMAQKIGLSIQAKQVYLVGSYARGTAHEQSDVDFIVIIPNKRLEGQSALSTWHKARLAVQDSTIGVDILIFSESDWEKWHASSYHILGNCQREGQLLYAP